jgi:Choline/ethanolamine kinase
VLANIKKHVPTWAPLSEHQVSLTRLSGLSNACYRVQHKVGDIQPHSLLYRCFECPIVDWNMENEIFESLSEQDLGPKLYHQCQDYRIEEFFLSRPITVFEMRNEIYIKAYSHKICDFNYN